MSSRQSNRCKLLLDLVAKSHKEQLNNTYNDSEIMENVDANKGNEIMDCDNLVSSGNNLNKAI